MAEDVGIYDDSEPLVATWGQWKDLANRVKSAGGTDITVTSVDPGEGSTLAEGEFIGVYGNAELVQTADIANTAITTAKIANKAVTSDKIDFTTLKYLSGMPVATITQSMGFDSTIPIRRIGNICIINSFLIQSQNPGAAGSWISLSETIPSGYRPTSEIYIFGNGYDNFDFSPRVWCIYPSGEMTLASFRDGEGKRFYLSSVWITNDAWPS